MCIEITIPSDLKITEEDVEAYKVVTTAYNNSNLKESEFTPSQRISQFGYGRGQSFSYNKGAILQSPIPQTPGIYLFPTKKDAENYRDFAYPKFLKTVIKVLIPKGERIYTGRISSERVMRMIINTINASKVHVLD